ncbi:MAG: 4'-phosphopantetheinyl transferase superfamily protein [Planctomycetota bacterium]
MLLPEGSKVVTAALDVDTRNPLTQLCHLCAILYTAGVPMKLDALFDHRAVRSLNLDVPDAPPAKPKMAIPLRIDWTPLYSPNVPPRKPSAEPAASATALPVETTTARTESSSLREPATPERVKSAAQEPRNGHVATKPADIGARPMEVQAAAKEDDDRSPVAPAVEFAVDPVLASRLPILGQFGRVTHFVPNEQIMIVRDLVLEEDHFLADHLFVFAESKPASHCLPVLPLTMSMEFVAETASLLTPGLGVIGYENIRGRRWIGLRDSSLGQIRIEGKLASVDPETGLRRVECGIYFEDKLSFSATVVCGSEYRQDLPMQVVSGEDEGPWPFTVEQVYGERLMFHGPSFHVVAGLFGKGNPTGSAALYVRPKDRIFTSMPDPMLITDPCLMDGIGQIVGLWTMCYDQYILPTSADKVEFYCPTPPVGTVAPIRVEIIEFNLETKQIRANIEIEDGQGNVWVRVSNWSEWIMNWPKNYAECTRLPDRYLLVPPFSLPGLPADAVCSLVSKQDFTGVDLDWAARIFLHANELPAYFAAQGNKRKREIVLSRSAVKDAVRVWWVNQYGGGYPHPADLSVGHDEWGRPFLEPGNDPSLPKISIAHTENIAIGVASATPIGIDIEPVSSGAPKILSHFATPSEISLVEGMERQESGQAWETRLWCAKEALSKLIGTGLQGKPKNFEAVDGDVQGCFLMQHVESGERFVVQTTYLNGFIVGYASAPGAPATESPCAARWQLLSAEQTH